MSQEAAAWAEAALGVGAAVKAGSVINAANATQANLNTAAKLSYEDISKFSPKGANSGGRVVLDLFGGKTSQIPGAINVDITATQGVRASATQLPFRAGIADEVIASNPYIPGGGGMMAFLPEAAQTLKPGGQLIINATQRNPFGVLPDAKALENLELRVVQENGPLLPRFESHTFRFTDGRIIPNTSVRTTILEKVK